MGQLTPLAALDWAIIAAFFVITLVIGLAFAKRASTSTDDYFVAGRKMTWWVAGTSMVATSFAADTPLVIAGWMRTIGLERNWFWWGSIMGFMLCTFFFARRWRRAQILTDVEFNELRYSGNPAAALRIVYASYRSLIHNTLVMCWVTLAMTKIMEVTLNIPTAVFVDDQWLPVLVAKGTEIAAVIDPSQISDWPIIGEAIISAKVIGILLCLTTAAIYSSISGLWGVMATDFFQFCLAMVATVLLMAIVIVSAGGTRAIVANAKATIEQGEVVNRKPAKRQTFGATSPGATELKQAQLAAAGASEDSLVWKADGLTELQVRERLKQTAVADNAVDSAVGTWRSAYTLSEGEFHDFDEVDRMLAAGILFRDVDGKGKKYDHYRLASVSWTDSELHQRLNAAGVKNRGDIVAAWHKDKVTPSNKLTNFLPPFDLRGGALLAVWALVVFLGFQWWAAGEGGGFLAQRLFSCKNERHSVLAMLWFNMAHFVLRPWPWIIVGIASIFLIPDVTVYGEHYDAEYAYVIMLMKYLPIGLKGVMVASLMAAYMSTISTHVNFGASYVVNDIWMRFIKPNGTQRSNVMVSRIVSLFLAMFAGIAAYFATNIGTLWLAVFEVMSGAGLVILLRWYWWRINAWSELSAIAATLLIYLLLNHTHAFHSLFEVVGAPLYFLDAYPVRFTINLVCSTAIWVTVTLLTPPERDEHLVAFYQRIRPGGWWRRIAAKAGNPNHVVMGWVEWACWALGVSGMFAMLVGLGKLCFAQYLPALVYVAYGIGAGVMLFRLLKRMDWSDVHQTLEPPDTERFDTSA